MLPKYKNAPRGWVRLQILFDHHKILVIPLLHQQISKATIGRDCLASSADGDQRLGNTNEALNSIRFQRSPSAVLAVQF